MKRTLILLATLVTLILLTASVCCAEAQPSASVAWISMVAQAGYLASPLPTGWPLDDDSGLVKTLVQLLDSEVGYPVNESVSLALSRGLAADASAELHPRTYSLAVNVRF